MAFFGEDIDPKLLLNEMRQLFNAPATPAPEQGQSLSGDEFRGYQPPIKATWYNSGGFDNTGQLRPNGRRGHGGIDMRTQGGTPVYPMAPGVVTNVGTDPLGGNVVNVDHQNGVTSYYAHLSTAKVFKGDRVGYDTVLGTVGNTGNAKNGVHHVHFQTWKNGTLVDPAQFFSVPKYTDIQPEEKARGVWVSDRARQEAANFNMQQHNQSKRLAFSRDVDRLLKCAHQFYKLVSGQSKNQ